MLNVLMLLKQVVGRLPGRVLWGILLAVTVLVMWWGYQRLSNHNDQLKQENQSLRGDLNVAERTNTRLRLSSQVDVGIAVEVSREISEHDRANQLMKEAVFRNYEKLLGQYAEEDTPQPKTLQQTAQTLTTEEMSKHEDAGTAARLGVLADGLFDIYCQANAAHSACPPVSSD